MALAVDILSIVAAVGSGVIAGVFLPFSTFLVRTWRELGDDPALRAMQSINRTITRGVFLPIFTVTALVCLAVAILVIVDFTGADAVVRLFGAACYVIGAFIVTVVANVPRNNALDRQVPGTAEGRRGWADFRGGWTAWNHVRTICSLVAAVSFTVAAAL